MEPVLANLDPVLADAASTGDGLGVGIDRPSVDRKGNLGSRVEAGISQERGFSPTPSASACGCPTEGVWRRRDRARPKQGLFVAVRVTDACCAGRP
jgi:hypothetical protein